MTNSAQFHFYPVPKYSFVEHAIHRILWIVRLAELAPDLAKHPISWSTDTEIDHLVHSDQSLDFEQEGYSVDSA